MSTDAACMLVRGSHFISFLPSIYERPSPIHHPGTRPIEVTWSPKKPYVPVGIKETKKEEDEH